MTSRQGLNHSQHAQWIGSFDADEGERVHAASCTCGWTDLTPRTTNELASLRLRIHNTFNHKQGQR